LSQGASDGMPKSFATEWIPWMEGVGEAETLGVYCVAAMPRQTFTHFVILTTRSGSEARRRHFSIHAVPLLPTPEGTQRSWHPLSDFEQAAKHSTTPFAS